MYFEARSMHYRLRGMRVDRTMLLGMVLMVIGVMLTAYGLFPRSRSEEDAPARSISIHSLDDARLTRAHLLLIAAMAIAVTIDVMKPTTLAFVASGAAREYGLRSPLNPASRGLPIALYPLSGITGTVIGSVTWGWLSDKVGRRASILIAAVMFVCTSTCGAMPTYTLNLAMCFAMGLGVGGMLPIIFALVSETMPARHRGWIVVLIGGDVAGAYIIMSWLASTIGASNRYGWRSLWLVGIPVSLLLVLVNLWIPESPRFLLQHGRVEEAQGVIERYGATAVVILDDLDEPALPESPAYRYADLTRRPFTGVTIAIVLLAVGIGVVQYGFQQWMPSNLQHFGYSEVSANRLLRNSALVGFPLNFPVAILYGMWSSKKTILGMCGVTALSLVGFAIMGASLGRNRFLVDMLLIVPIWGISSLTAVAAAYACELYPTAIRGRGTGLTSGATKVGGVLILAAVAARFAAPSVGTSALIGALPVLGGGMLLLYFGVETRTRPLEEIRLTGQLLGRQLQGVASGGDSAAAG